MIIEKKREQLNKILQETLSKEEIYDAGQVLIDFYTLLIEIDLDNRKDKND